MQIPSISIPFLIIGITLFYLAQYAWKQQSSPSGRSFSLSLFAIALISSAYAFELASLDLATALLWSKIQYIGILSFPVLYLIFVYQYLGRAKWLNSKNIALLFIPGILLFIVKLFDECLFWIYASAEMVEINSNLLLTFTWGPLYLFGSMYQLSLITLANILLALKRRFSSELYRKHTGIILLSASIVYLVYFVYLLDIPIPGLEGIDINPLAFAVMAGGASIAIFRYRFLDLTPIARDALIETLNDGLVVLDTRSRIVDANPKALEIFAWEDPPFGELAESLMAQWLNPEFLEAIKSPVKHQMNLNEKHATIYYEVTVSVLREGQGPKLGYIALIHDVSEQKKVEQELKELSLLDELSGLANRRGFKILADQLLAMAHRMQLNVVLFYCDIDGMKAINDSLGHAAGDQAIKDLASIFRNSFRSSDVIARLGGDEFVCLGIEATENSSETLEERLRANLDKHSQLGRDYQLSMSTGLAHFEGSKPKPLKTLLKEGDRAMYKVKQAKNASD